MPGPPLDLASGDDLSTAISEIETQLILTAPSSFPIEGDYRHRPWSASSPTHTPTAASSSAGRPHRRSEQESGLTTGLGVPPESGLYFLRAGAAEVGEIGPSLCEGWVEVEGCLEVSTGSSGFTQTA